MQRIVAADQPGSRGVSVRSRMKMIIIFFMSTKSPQLLPYPQAAL